MEIIYRAGGGGGYEGCESWITGGMSIYIYKVWRTIKPRCSTYGALNKIMIFSPCHHGGPTQVTHLKH